MYRFVLACLGMTVGGIFVLIEGECHDSCRVPTLVYEDLKCTPKYTAANYCCPKEYDCSNIYTRPPGTCHLRGKLYRPGQKVDPKIISGNCFHNCACDESQTFSCIEPSDGCAEWWVPGYPMPGCYLKYQLDHCCAVDQQCPPFNDNVKCNVSGKTFKEGEIFQDPKQKCTRCICQKGFSGKFDPPMCQRMNCSTEIRYSKEIDSFCAPFYRNLKDCCPNSWFCPSDDGLYIPTSGPPSTDTHCKFGERIMYIGEKYELSTNNGHRKVSCECVVPPYLSCFEQIL